MKIKIGNNGNKKLIITGIICITALEAIALIMGVNGLILTAVIAVIAAAIGVVMPTPKFLKN